MNEPCKHERELADVLAQMPGTQLVIEAQCRALIAENAALTAERDEALDDLDAARRKIEDLTDEVAEVERLKDALDATFNERCERDATIERVRALCDEDEASVATGRIRAALDAPTDPAPKLERESDAPTPIGNTSTAGPGRLVGYGNTSTSSGYKRTFHGNSVTG